jgi:D-2-hydroxyacid dehydrogenase (NADP+)
MSRVLILLTLPGRAAEHYRDLIGAKFPELEIDVANDKPTFEANIGAADVLITFGPMVRNLKLDLKDAVNVKWMQGLGTGMDGIIDHPSLKPDVIITSMTGIHGPPVSEAALAGMLALSRGTPGFVRNQDQHQWVRWPARLLHGKTVGILGIGVIAEALAPKCKALGMTVIGISSAPRKLPGFDRMHGLNELLRVVPELDYFVLLTPYTAAPTRPQRAT